MIPQRAARRIHAHLRSPPARTDDALRTHHFLFRLFECPGAPAGSLRPGHPQHRDRARPALNQDVLPTMREVRDQFGVLCSKVESLHAFVLIFGPLKSGKSTLMNALAGAYVSEVSSLPAYPCMVFVSHAERASFRVTRYDGGHRSAERSDRAAAPDPAQPRGAGGRDPQDRGRGTRVRPGGGLPRGDQAHRRQGAGARHGRNRARCWWTHGSLQPHEVRLRPA